MLHAFSILFLLYYCFFESVGIVINPACESNIYCFGPVLDAAQKAWIYNDSKSFVDSQLNYPENEILENFQTLNETTEGKFTSEDIEKFVDENFSPPGSELEEWIPSDWTENPEFLHNIKDPILQDWAKSLNELWKQLGRRVIDDVKQNSSYFSLIPINHPVIVPGGRFREFYYWDTFWIFKGLLLSEMDTTVRGMLSNFLDMIKQFGFIPNGGRIYYTKRSQPPFLIPMFDLYISKNEDESSFLKDSIDILEIEYNFWLKNRSVEVDSHLLNYYASNVNQPRPESYREDYNEIEDLDPDSQLSLMTHLTSACESGWDFSSRWAGVNYNPQKSVISQLKTRDIIPVDLNCILAWNEKLLAKFHRKLGNELAALEYDNKYEERTHAIEQLLWDDEDGTYYDYQISAKKQNKQYFASNLIPLWTKCYSNETNVEMREKRLYQYLQNVGVLNFPGGIPTSLIESGEQWDFPNAWPPLVHMIIEGLRTSSNQDLQNEAFKQAEKWVNGNFRAYTKSEAMFEKYNVTASDGIPGSGGEYEVQLGFGWTNGVILSLLDEYGESLAVNNVSLTTDSPNEMTTNAGFHAGVQNGFANAICLLILWFYFL